MKKISQKKSHDNEFKDIASVIAEELEDLESIKFYQDFCKKYPIEIILKAFRQSAEIPNYNIMKSRAVLFILLVNQYAQNNEKD